MEEFAAAERRLVWAVSAGLTAIVMLVVGALGAYLLLARQADTQDALRSAEADTVAYYRDLLRAEVLAAENYMEHMRSQTEASLRSSLREHTDMALAQVQALHDQAVLLDLPQAEAQRMALEALRPQRFLNGRGYYFVDDLDGLCLLLPTAPQMEGKSLYDNRDDTGHYIMRGLIVAAGQPVGEGFSRYRWYSPLDPKRMSDKLAYVRLFEPWGWIIGAGDYLESMEEEQKRQALARFRSLRFGEAGYLFVLGPDRRVTLAPSTPDSEGKLPEELSPQEAMFLTRFLEVGAEGGYVDYSWRRNDGAVAQKLAYVKRVEPWGWTIGAAYYVDDVRARTDQRLAGLRQRLHQEILAAIAVVAVAGALAVMVSLTYARWFHRVLTAHRVRLAEQANELGDKARQLFLVKSAIDRSRDMVLLLDENQHPIYFNQAAEAALGSRSVSSSGHFIQGMDKIPVDGSSFVTTLNTDHGALPVEVLAQRVTYMNGTYLCAVARDIRERQTYEQQLSAINQELSRSNQELEQFAYVASHDLREPLRMVTSFLTLMERRMGDRLDEENLEYLSFARDGARRMDAMIRDLLDYSRIGRNQPDPQPVKLAQTVAEALANLRPGIEEAAASVTVADDLPTVQGNPAELVRLFQNLIGNALKYRAPDRPCRVEVLSRSNDGQPELVVRDNGIGIDPEFRDRIFGIFQRLHGRDTYDGTGIGLAACRKIADHHGATVLVRDAPDDQGVEFVVRFPAPVPS